MKKQTIKGTKKEYLRTHPNSRSMSVEVKRSKNGFIIYDNTVKQCLPFKGNRSNSSLDAS